MRNPTLIIEASYAPAEALCLRGTGRRENCGKSFLIAKKLGFLRHHVVLGGSVCPAVNGERCGPPLAEHVLTDPLILRCVSPKEQKLRAPPRANCSLQGFDIVN